MHYYDAAYSQQAFLGTGCMSMYGEALDTSHKYDGNHKLRNSRYSS